MFFRRIVHHFKEGVIGVWRHFGMCISSASAITITLTLISVFLMVTSNLESMTSNIEDSLKISVLVKYDAENKINEISEKIKKIEGVTNVVHRTKEEEYKFYLDTYHSEQKELFKAYEDVNPFHEAFMVEIKDGNQLDFISNQIKQIDGVDSANYGGVSFLKLVDFLNSIRLGGLILVSSLCFLTIYLVYNTIKLTITARADEIHIMRNVGALNSYVIVPFLVEGILIGLIGSIVPIGLSIYGYLKLYSFSGGFFISEIFLLIEPFPFIFKLVGILLAIGLLVGFVGSFIGVRKYLRLRR